MQPWNIRDKDGSRVIMIDMDCTLVDTKKGLADWAAQRHAEPFDMNSPSYHMETWHPELDITKAFHDQHFFRNLAPYPDAIKAVRLLHEMGHDVAIATSPRCYSYEFSAREKALWVNEHLPFIKHVYLCDDKTALRADYLIDDNPHIAERGLFAVPKRAPVWEHVVFLQSYNRDFAAQRRMSVIESWTALCAHLES